MDTEKGVNQQLQDSQQAACAMTQVQESVNEVAISASGAAEASSAAEQASVVGHQLVANNRLSYINLATEIESSAQIIENLSKESNNIGAMLNNIRSIAEQTNLLALNAAIEAARAGEQGRGFAVVADEVRTLAQRSAESTQEIEHVINRLQSLAKDAVAAMKQGQSQVEESVNNSSQVEQALTDINTSSEIVNSMNVQIATAAEQQSVVTLEISNNISSIADIAHNTSLLSASVCAASEQLHTLSEQLGQRVLTFTLSKQA